MAPRLRRRASLEPKTRNSPVRIPRNPSRFFIPRSSGITSSSGGLGKGGFGEVFLAFDEELVVKENATARIDGLRASLSVLAVIALIALFFSRRIPTRQPSAAPSREPLSARGDQRTAVQASRLPRIAAYAAATFQDLTVREAGPALYLS